MASVANLSNDEHGHAEAAERLRVDLAAAMRMAARLGMHEGVCNHFSAQMPGRPDLFLMNPRGRHWSRMRASDLIAIDADGNTVEGTGRPLRTGHTIHTRMHMLHPDAPVVLHTHMPYATALAALREGELLPVHQNATRFLGNIAYDRDFGGIAFGVEEGERMARVCGDKRVMFLANHGVVVIADTVAEAFDDLFFLERACQVQVMAMWTGQPLALIPDDVAAETARQLARRAESAHLHFAECKAILDEQEPDYAS